MKLSTTQNKDENKSTSIAKPKTSTKTTSDKGATETLQETKKKERQKRSKQLIAESLNVHTAYSKDAKDTFYDLVTNYQEICQQLCSQEKVQDQYFLQRIDKIGLLSRVFPQSIIALSELCDTSEYDAIASNTELVNNTTSIHGAFNYNKVLGKVVDAKYRYLVNMPGEYVQDYLRGKIQDDDITYNAKLFLSVGNQSRWGDLWRQIFSAYLWMDTVTEANAWRHTNLLGRDSKRFATELETVKAISAILKRFDTLPWYIRFDKNIVIERTCTTKWHTSIASLLYSLLELSKEEKGCNVTPEAVKEMIKFRFQCAKISFEQEMLNAKKVRASILKTLTFELGDNVRISRSEDYQSEQITQDVGGEIEIYDNERKALMDTLKEKLPRGYLHYLLNKFKIIQTGDASKNTETLRFLHGEAQIFFNPGIYYDTAITLEAIKSIEAQIKNIPNLPKPIEEVDLYGMRYTSRYNWDTGSPVWKIIKETYYKMLDGVIEVLQQKDFEEFFVSLLTNRSQGEKVSLNEFTSIDTSDDRIKLLKSVAQARLAVFCLAQEEYQNMDKYLETLEKWGLCTTRKQNDRRKRVVVMVPNADQVAFAIVLRVFNALKKHHETIAVGKQEGGAYDMALQLWITGNKNSASVFSDVASMDASTILFLGSVFMQLISEYIIEHGLGPDKYFAASTTKAQVYELDKDQSVVKVFPALAISLFLVLGNIQNKRYHIKDPVFGSTIEINPQVFPSGRFDTSAQHTTFLSIIADAVKKLMETKFGRGFMTLYERRFGDDAYTGIVTTDHRQLESYVRYYIDYTNELLTQACFEVEAEASRFYGDFLQQTAFNGIIIPKSARTSFYCDEQQQTAMRDPLAQVSIISSVSLTASQRTYAPENVTTLADAAWIMVKTLRVVADLKPSGELIRYIKHLGRRTYLMFPFYCLHLPPFSHPNKNIRLTEEKVLPYTSLMHAVGISKLVYLQNCMYSEQDWAALEERYNLEAIDPISLFSKKGRGQDFVDVLVFNSYSRSQVLEKHRSQLLSDDIGRMANVLDGYQNRGRMMLSYHAWTMLNDTFGIKVPTRLSYWAQSHEKISNMFKARTEMENEAIIINNDMIKYYNQSLHSIPKKVRYNFITTCIRITPNEKFDYNPRFSVLLPPILPGYREGSEYYLYQHYTGNAVMDRGHVSKALQAMETKYGQNFDLQAALEFGSIAKERGAVALSYFLDVLSLSDTLKADLRFAILSNENYISDLFYNTGFQRDIQFGISGEARVFQDIITNKLNVKSLDRLIPTILRDIHLLAINLYYGHKVSIGAAAITKNFYNRRRIQIELTRG